MRHRASLVYPKLVEAQFYLADRIYDLALAGERLLQSCNPVPQPGKGQQSEIGPKTKNRYRYPLPIDLYTDSRGRSEQSNNWVIPHAIAGGKRHHQQDGDYGDDGEES